MNGKFYLTESEDKYLSYDMVKNTYERENMSELDSLIFILRHKIKTKDYQLKYIKYPKTLVKSLVELKNLVGMERLKDSIALQVMRLIDGAKNNEIGTHMLNTILYGPPGVGKTKVGIILSKIWYSLGYLNSSNPKKQETKYNQQTVMENQINPYILIILAVLFYGFTYITTGLSYIYNTWGFYYLISFLFLVFLIVIILYYNNTTYTYINNIVKVEENKNSKPKELLKVVSRQDFVADYMGQTATKTKALLHNNIGKVLFIDEAYSLFNGERDQFGQEALTTLNLFMSENPNKIAVIFAGYKDLMKYGIFRIQPGLPRRCMWHFECDGYDGEELCDIFERQVENDNWVIDRKDYDKIRDLVAENVEMFKNYGGDTERLLFFCQLESSRDNMFQNSRKGNKIICYEHVINGLKRLKQNDIQSS